MKKILGFVLGVALLVFIPVTVFASGAPVQGSSRYTTPSGPAASDGTSTETISIHLQDTDQNNVVGDIITLSSSNDSTATFPKNNQTTDSNGDASFTVATSTPGDVKITLTDTTNSVTFTDWFSVNFYDSTKGCTNVPAAPVLTSVTSDTNNKATLKWTDSANPVNNYLVSFGTEAGKYIYGDPNVGTQGTSSYTAQSLTANKKYYFVVSATNNCGRSGFSNEMAVIVKPIPSTPIPTIKPTTAPTIVSSATQIPVINVTVGDSPLPSETPANGTLSQSDVSTKYRNIGLGIIASGILVIVIVLVTQWVINKNSIPQISDNKPQQPFTF